MNILKRKLMLLYLKHKTAVSKFEVCDKLRPYLRHYGLSLSDDEIVFPAERCYEQKIIQLISAQYLYRESIPYESVIQIDVTSCALVMVLRTGHLFFFSLHSPLWKIHNLYDYGEPAIITRIWWKVAGNFKQWWWNLRKFLGFPRKIPL